MSPALEAALLREGWELQRLTPLEPGRWPVRGQARTLRAQSPEEAGLHELGVAQTMAPHESGGFGFPPQREREPFKGDIGKWGACRGAERMKERLITMEMGDDGKGRGLTWRRACGSWTPTGFPPEGSYVFCLRLLRAEGGPVVKSLTAPCGLGLSEGGFLGASGKLS